MIIKKFTPKKTICKATFSIPKSWAKKSVAIAGSFNNWQTDSDLLKPKKDSWEIELKLKPESNYRFKYYIDGERWENDDAADSYVPNDYGTEDSVINTDS